VILLIINICCVLGPDDASGRKELLDSYLSQISMGNSLDDHKTKEELTQKFLNHRSEKRTTLNGTYVEEKMGEDSSNIIIHE